jgi:hypothetical protein
LEQEQLAPASGAFPANVAKQIVRTRLSLFEISDERTAGTAAVFERDLSMLALGWNVHVSRS